MTVKIALDIHGVIDELPTLFSFLSKSIIASGGEVHILTGIHSSKEVLQDLEDKGISYTNFFSISDYHKQIGTPMTYKKENHPVIDDELWNRTKGDYCKQNNIDLCIDDSGVYNEHFSTPYCQFFLNKQKITD